MDDKDNNIQEVRAVLRFLRQGPRKVRLVGDLLKGLDVAHARSELKHINKRASQPLLKLLNSAVANALHNAKVSEERLVVRQVRVDDGPVLKRFMPRAHGRASGIKKRSCHVTIVLGVKEKTESKESKKVKTEGKV